MSVDEAKLRAMIAPGTARVELALLTQRGDSSERSVLGWWDPPYDPAQVVRDALDLAQNDTNAARARCVYSFTVCTKPPQHRRLAFQAQPDAEPVAGATEAPTQQGFLAQLMRHKEAEVRVSTQGRIDVDEAWKGLFGVTFQVMEKMGAHLSNMQEREAKTVELYGQLQSRGREHELAMLLAGAEAQRNDKLIDTVLKPAIPHLAPAISAFVTDKLRGKAPAVGQPPAAAPPADASPGAPGAAAAPPPPPAPVPPPRVPLRDLVMLLAEHDVDADGLAETLAAKLPADQQERAKTLVVEAIHDAIKPLKETAT